MFFFKNYDFTKKIDFTEKFKHFPLHAAAKENYVKVVKQLLTYGAKTEVYDYKNETPLYMAAKNGHHEVVIELIKHGAEVNGIVNTICDLSLLNRLSKYHPIIQRYFQNCQRVPLNIAVLEGHLKVVQELLQNGANISIANHNRQTALHLACEKGYFVFGLAGSETGNEYRTLSICFSYVKTPMRAAPSPALVSSAL